MILKDLRMQGALLTSTATIESPTGVQWSGFVPTVKNMTPNFTVATKGAFTTPTNAPPGYAQTTVFKPDPNQIEMYDNAEQVVLAPNDPVLSRTVDHATASDDRIYSQSPHELQPGDRVRFANLPSGTGLSNGVDYYVTSPLPTGTNLAFKVSATRFGADNKLNTIPVDITADIGTGSGATFTVHGYVGGRPRCMGNLQAEAQMDPLPDGSRPYTYIGGVDVDAGTMPAGTTAPAETFQQAWICANAASAEAFLPAAVGGAPIAAAAYHGESGRIVPKEVDPNALRYDYPPYQFHAKRLLKNGKLSFYCKGLGGRYAPVVGAETIAQAAARLGWTPEGQSSKPSGGSSTWYWLEMVREWDIFPTGPMPVNEPFYLRWAIRWSNNMTDGRIRIWTYRIGDSALTLAVDSRVTPYYDTPSHTVTPPVVGGQGLGGANVFLHPDYPDEFVNNAHFELGYYAPTLGVNSTNYFPAIFTNSYSTTGVLIADSVVDMDDPTSSAPATVAPSNTAAPVITGAAQEGLAVTCSAGTWTGSPVIACTYQWQHDLGAGFVDVAGETGNTYVITAAEVGNQIRCVVTATNSVGSASATTAVVSPTGVPTTGSAPTNLALPQIITDTLPEIGDTVFATDGTWTDNPTGFTYQWTRSGSPISSATEPIYQFVPEDLGRDIHLVVTAHNGVGSGSATSLPVAPQARQGVAVAVEQWGIAALV